MIQGTAADMTKLACIIFYNTIIKKGWLFKVKIINIVHDEILIEAPEEIIEEATNLLVRSMEKAGDTFCQIIPLTAEPAVSDYWIH